MIEDVVQYQGRGHVDPSSVEYQVVPMAVDAVLLATPGNDRSYLAIGVPGLRTGAQFAVVPASCAVTKDGACSVLSQERGDDLVWNWTRSWNGIA